jgi:hypothetical protein
MVSTNRVHYFEQNMHHLFIKMNICSKINLFNKMNIGILHHQ